MRARRPAPVLLALTLAGALTITSASAASPASTTTTDPGTSDARVRLTGELVRTAVEVTGDRQWFAVNSGDRLVPVAGDELADIDTRSTVTLEVAVPDDVVEAAATDGAISIPAPGGRSVLHELSPADLRAATDGTPAPAGSAIGEATTAAPLAPGGDPLPVAEIVDVRATGAAYTPATRRITYVEVTPKGARRSPVTTAAATRQVAGANSFWRDNSSSTLRIGAPTVKARYTSRYTCRDNPFAMWEEAVTRTGWTMRANASLVLKLPESAYESQGCSWGLATMGTDPNDWGFAYTSTLHYSVLAHELGHNMSLGHADALHCDGRTDAALPSTGVWSNRCREEVYGDYQDVMGPDTTGTAAMLSSPQALTIGTLPKAARVPLGAGTRTVTLAPMSGMTGVRAAVVVNAVTRARYYVEYRPATGRDAPFAQYQRPGVRVLRYNPDQQSSVLLDPTPSGYRDDDPVLTAGRSLTSYDGRIRITVVSTSATGAVVQVRNNATLRLFTTTAVPRITGARGVGKRLTASTGTWSPAPSSYAYRWYRNGRAISGATRRTHTPTRADAGRYLTVRVTATRVGYVTKAATSKRVGIPMYATTRPAIAGTPSAGRTLAIRVGAWTPRATSHRYQWYRDGAPITGATARTYTVTRIDRGKRIKARVTARRSGYVSGSAITDSRLIR